MPITTQRARRLIENFQDSPPGLESSSRNETFDREMKISSEPHSEGTSKVEIELFKQEPSSQARMKIYLKKLDKIQAFRQELFFIMRALGVRLVRHQIYT